MKPSLTRGCFLKYSTGHPLNTRCLWSSERLAPVKTKLRIDAKINDTMPKKRLTFLAKSQLVQGGCLKNSSTVSFKIWGLRFGLRRCHLGMLPLTPPVLVRGTAQDMAKKPLLALQALTP